MERRPRIGTSHLTIHADGRIAHELLGQLGKVGLEVVDELDLAFRLTTANRDDGAAEPFRAVMGP